MRIKFICEERLQLSTVRIIVIDDYEPWRQFVASTLKERTDLQIIAEAADGMEAVQKVQELQPELILLDIGLPKLNGIDAAHRIRERWPNTRILFCSQNRSRDIAEEAMRTGDGYVVKAGSRGELLAGVDAVLQGKRFLSDLVAE